MVRPVGIGPTTIGLKGHCSTTELQAHVCDERDVIRDGSKVDCSWLSLFPICGKIVPETYKIIKMRIAMIGVDGLPSLYPVVGGVETHVEHLAGHLVARGHEVTVYVRRHANPNKRKSSHGIRIVTLPSWYRKNLDTITHTFLASVHALTQPYEVIHYHGVGPSTLAWIPRLFKRDARVIVTFHSRDQFHEKWGLFARLYLAFAEWTAVKIPHATIAVSHGIQILCNMMFGAKVYHIPNGVEIPKKKPHADELKKFGLGSGRYFLCLARLVPHKAQDVLIRAFRLLKTDHKLAIVGSASFDDVDYAEELKRLAGDDERIIFTGQQCGVALHQLIANSAALVHPSRSEGLSVSVLEAMSYGKLVIMSDIPENLELIDHSGICFKTGDVEGLVGAMQWSLDDAFAAKARGLRAQDIIKRLYSWDAVVRRVENVYRNREKI